MFVFRMNDSLIKKPWSEIKNINITVYTKIKNRFIFNIHVKICPYYKTITLCTQTVKHVSRYYTKYFMKLVE